MEFEFFYLSRGDCPSGTSIGTSKSLVNSSSGCPLAKFEKFNVFVRRERINRRVWLKFKVEAQEPRRKSLRKKTEKKLKMIFQSRERKSERKLPFWNISFRFIFSPFSVLAIQKQWETYKKPKMTEERLSVIISKIFNVKSLKIITCP